MIKIGKSEQVRCYFLPFAGNANLPGAWYATAFDPASGQRAPHWHRTDYRPRSTSFSEGY